MLDGLDECNGEEAQTLIIRLISQFTTKHTSSPLVWIIASRPEVHLRLVFNSQEITGSFKEHSILANSDDACRDVETFLRSKFEEIRQNYKDLIPGNTPWPLEQKITRIARTSGGLFVFAATVICFIGDPHVGDPVFQLDTALSVTIGLEPGSLSVLYAFYSAILAAVPPAMSLGLRMLLSFYVTLGRGSSVLPRTQGIPSNEDYPLVLVATIFGLPQNIVYGALRKLHSVIKVPHVDESGRCGIKFYHTSFADYLKTLEDYAIDVGMMTRMWSGYCAILHEGNSVGKTFCPATYAQVLIFRQHIGRPFIVDILRHP